MRALGAEVVFHGRDFDDAREYCEKQAAEHGYRYFHSGDEPLLIAGVATYTLEILEARPDIEVIVVPVGGGSGAAGACVVAKAVRPSIEVIGVQSEAAPAGLPLLAGPVAGRRTRRTRSPRGWRPAPRSSCRSGSCGSCWTTSSWSPTMRCRPRPGCMIEKTRNLVEPAGAAALAAVLAAPGRFAGRKVAIVCSGGNISPAQLLALWPRGNRLRASRARRSSPSYPAAGRSQRRHGTGRGRRGAEPDELLDPDQPQRQPLVPGEGGQRRRATDDHRVGHGVVAAPPGDHAPAGRPDVPVQGLSRRRSAASRTRPLAAGRFPAAWRTPPVRSGPGGGGPRAPARASRRRTGAPAG